MTLHRLLPALLPAAAAVLLAGGAERIPLSEGGPGRGKTPLVAPGPRIDCVKSGCHEAMAAKKVPHQPVKQGSCEACHEEVDEKGHKFKLTSDEPKLCTECHEKVLEEVPHLHGPVAGGSCTACHDPHGSDHEKVLRLPPTELCLDCHDGVKKELESGAKKHKPAAEECLACHLPHGGKDKTFTRLAGAALCLDCHDDVKTKAESAKVAHDAIKDGRACLACHAPHAAAQDGLLAKPSKQLCLGCHDKELKAGERTIADIAGLLKSHPVQHGPIKQDECVPCHAEVHGGAHPSLLMGDYPQRFYAPFDSKAYGLCFECHDAALATAERTTDATEFRNGDQNLHALHVNKSPKGRTCGVCHDVHASKQPRLVREAVPFGDWRLPIRFTKSDGGGTCATGCHRPYGYDRANPVANVPPAPPGASPSPPPPTNPPGNPPRPSGR